MAKINAGRPRTAPAPVSTGRSPIVAPMANTRTFNGGQGFTRTAQSELFLLAVSLFAGEDTFYETADTRLARFTSSVRQLAVTDPQFVADLLTWLRREGNIRTAAIIGAAEFVSARLAAGVQDAPEHARGLSRIVVDSVIVRADEAAEMIAYWTRTHGRRLPMPIKRGVADAVTRLYSERNYLKWDSQSAGVRMADVVELVHPTPKAPWQDALFSYMLDMRHHPADAVLPESLGMLRARAELTELAKANPRVLLDPAALEAAGMTWENALSMAGNRLDKAALWTAIIPSMGYMALLRNLRNFDEAGVNPAQARMVADRLRDPDEVARSRQFPFRFLSAYRNAPSLRWSQPLDEAMTASLANVPRLPGRTLVLVDCSGSMGFRVSSHSTVAGQDQASVFGASLALAAESADLVKFGSGSQVIPMRRGDSLLTVIQRIGGGMGGTETARAVRDHFRGHDRVVIVTDEQANRDFRPVGESLPETVPLHVINIHGYRAGMAPSGGPNRHAYGGLTDNSFRMLGMVEQGQTGSWPWA